MNNTDKITVCTIAALANNRVIGKENDIPWNIPADMKHFANTTKGKPVIMGRKTWESLNEDYQPLPKRPNIIITSQDDYQASGATVTNSPEEALKKAKEIAKNTGVSEVFVMGGQSIYETLLPETDKLVLTLIDKGVNNPDTFFPAYENEFTEVEGSREEHPNNDPPFTFITLTR